jgi:hypothetical protein
MKQTPRAHGTTMAGTKPKATKHCQAPKPPNPNKPKQIELAGYFRQTAKIETGTS